MTFDINIHAKTIRLDQFWPGNINSLRIEFVPRAWSGDVKQQMYIFLQDAARAWELYDLLKDESTELIIKAGQSEADFRAQALKERELRIAREEARANRELVAEGASELEDEMPF